MDQSRPAYTVACGPQSFDGCDIRNPATRTQLHTSLMSATIKQPKGCIHFRWHVALRPNISIWQKSVTSPPNPVNTTRNCNGRVVDSYAVFWSFFTFVDWLTLELSPSQAMEFKRDKGAATKERSSTALSGHGTILKQICEGIQDRHKELRVYTVTWPVSLGRDCTWPPAPTARHPSPKLSPCGLGCRLMCLQDRNRRTSQGRDQRQSQYHTHMCVLVCLEQGNE